MRDEFDGQVAVVTGAAQGIGRAIAAELHAGGARLVLVDCNAQGAAEVEKTLNSVRSNSARICVVDLADPQSACVVASTIEDSEGVVDILVNNAGIELDLPLAGLTADRFDRLMAINLRAPLLLAQQLVPLFPERGGAILNVSSVHANRAFPNSIPYACSKAGMVALTRNLALELGPKKIRVNAICPGYVDTALWDAWVESSDDPAALAAQITAFHPLGRRGTPQDVASASSYLLGSKSEWITGTCLTVDGGLTVSAHP